MKFISKSSIVLIFLPTYLAEHSQEEMTPGKNGLRPKNVTPEEKDASPDLQDFKAFLTSWLDELEGDYPLDSNVIDANREDFESADIVDHSDKLTNARFATVDSFDNPTKVITVDSYKESHYAAANAIDGVVEFDNFDGDCVAQDRKTQAWFADITGNPSISFVKVWPSYHTQFGQVEEPNWGFYWTYRVFVNNIECYPIEYYSDNKVLEIYQTKKPLIFTCIETIPNANVVRLSAGDYGGHSPQYIFFSEVQVFESLECPTKPNESCTDAQLNNENKCERNYCGEEKGARVKLDRCTNTRCSCTNDATNEVVEYDIAKCSCPSNRGGERCEIDIPEISQEWL